MSSLPSAPWTDIDSTRVDQDSPESEDLYQDIVIDLNYLKNQADINRTMVVFQVSGTWTCPAGVTTIKIRGLAGGGGACRYQGAGFVQGGGGGAWVEYTRSVVPGTIYTINVGAGGQAGTIASGLINGAAGGDTWFDTNALKAGGGQGGQRAATNANGAAATAFSGTTISAPGKDAVVGNNLGTTTAFGGDAAMAWGFATHAGPGCGGNSVNGTNTETNGVKGFLNIEY